ncbi:MAG: YqgE/AlgH family protein [Rhodopirellula sp.]|mgnify:CR=1 FL=1|nr:YqgE/AlgH family protein [Rhodopirellula sp.]
MQSYEGHLLVASPQLLDPNFAKSLVFLIEHNEDGAFGMIVNRPISKTVQDLWREVGSEPCSSRRPVYLGGPVPGPLLSLHANSSLSEMEPITGVYFSARKPNLDRLVLDETSAQKVFLGHSGWGAGQLEQELDAGAWRTIPATAELIFSTDEELWDSVFRQLGRELLKSMLNLKDLPSDPSTN